MDRTGSVGFEGGHMRRRAISHVTIEAVGWIALREPLHGGIAMDLGDDRSRRDAGVLLIAL